MSDDIAKLAREVIALEDISGTWRDQAMLKLARAYLSTVTPPGSGEDAEMATSLQAKIRALSTSFRMSECGEDEQPGFDKRVLEMTAQVFATVRASATAAERDRCADIADSMTEYGVTGRQIAQALRDTQGGE